MEHARQEIPSSNTNRRYSMAGAISVPVNNDRESEYTYSADEYPTIILDKSACSVSVVVSDSTRKN